jgi:hypothetical protein
VTPLARLDAISDLLNKLLDKAQSVAPTVWEAALRQAQIDAQRSLYWGFFWTGVAVLLLVVAVGMAAAARGTVVHYKRAVEKADADYTLKLAEYKAAEGAKTKAIEHYTTQYLSYPSREVPSLDDDERGVFYSIMGAAILFFVLAAVMAVSSYWDAYRISSNPTWYAIQILKG